VVEEEDKLRVRKVEVRSSCRRMSLDERERRNQVERIGD